jgi:hypothetical protein
VTSTPTPARALVTRRFVAIAALAGVLLCAAAGATPREGNPSGVPGSPSEQVAAAPRTRLADAQPAAAPKNMALLDAVLSGTSPFKESARQLAVSVGLATTGNRILGPYSDIAAHVADALYEAVLPGSRSGTLHWPLLLLTLVIAVALFVMRAGRGARDAEGRERERGLGEYLFPRDIYTHRSARVDIGLYLLDRALMPVWIALGLGLIAPFVERGTILVAQDLFGPSPAFAVTLGWKLLYGLVTLLVADMILLKPDRSRSGSLALISLTTQVGIISCLAPLCCPAQTTLSVSPPAVALTPARMEHFGLGLTPDGSMMKVLDDDEPLFFAANGGPRDSTSSGAIALVIRDEPDLTAGVPDRRLRGLTDYARLWWPAVPLPQTSRNVR